MNSGIWKQQQQRNRKTENGKQQKNSSEYVRIDFISAIFCFVRHSLCVELLLSPAVTADAIITDQQPTHPRNVFVTYRTFGPLDGMAICNMIHLLYCYSYTTLYSQWQGQRYRMMNAQSSARTMYQIDKTSALSNQVCT